MVWAVDALQTNRVHAAARAATDSHGLQRALAATAEEKFDGWVLPSVVQELGAALERRKKFPFDLAEALPWWEALNQIEGSRGDG
jgi:hypothetical protein